MLPDINASVTSQELNFELRATIISTYIMYAFYNGNLSCRNHWGLGAGFITAPRYQGEVEVEVPPNHSIQRRDPNG